MLSFRLALWLLADKAATEPEDPDMAILDDYCVTVGGEKSYVYLGICNGRPTKWVTAAPWDFKIECQLNPASGELSYKDGQGRPMQVLESGDPEWSEW